MVCASVILFLLSNVFYSQKYPKINEVEKNNSRSLPGGAWTVSVLLRLPDIGSRYQKKMVENKSKK